MTAPFWKTPPGSLGTIQEQTFFELIMEAYDPETPDADNIEYKVISGQLPPGLVMYENGEIRGQPKNYYFVRGVPFDVRQDITSTFCCRAININTNEITDRTFSLTVTGEDAPQIITKTGELGRYLDGAYIDIQLEAIDLDDEPIQWSISKGELPLGLSLDPITGRITGIAGTYSTPDDLGSIGWNADAGWDELPWDINVKAINRTYEFVVRVTDGKSYDGTKYSIYIYSHDSLRTDNSLLTADNDTAVTADADTKRNPYLITRSQNLGVYTHDNRFAYKFSANDLDGDALEYSLLVGEGMGFDNEESGFDTMVFDMGDLVLPPGLTINQETGWMYGQFPRQIAGQREYTFGVQVYKKDYPDYKSAMILFKLTVVNDLRYLITWNESDDLGILPTGDISEKQVTATNPLNRSLFYTLSSGKLPQGLRLLSDGNIVGRASFETTSFDGGLTTYDSDVRALGAILDETTIDRNFYFTVKASDNTGEMISYKKFMIKVVPSSFGPSESLYLRAQPGATDKEIISKIFRNTDIIPSSVIYRNSDPNFGVSSDMRMLLIAGLNASTASEYIQAMATNHYRKVLKFGKYTWARALNTDGSVAYDVVYIPVVDDLMESNTTSVPASIDLSSKIRRNNTVDASMISMDSNLNSIDGGSDLTAYPNSIFNMRHVVRSNIGMASKEPLPRWMTSKQVDGRIPGWTPAIVVAYVNPGEGEKVVFNLNRMSSVDIKDVSFDVDRYIWDTNMSKNFNSVTNTYEESAESTFDKFDIDVEVKAIADFAVDVPFQYIDGRTFNFIDDNGGLDGIISTYVGMKIIFATQEKYTNFDGEYEGWVRYGTLWDGAEGFDSPNVPWDEYSIIPGYNDDDGSTLNQRSAVWEIIEGPDGELRLKLDTYIEPGDAVQVMNGTKYGGVILRYGPAIIFSANETVPKYRKYRESDETNQTTFDAEGTRFIDSITTYEDPDVGDKYLAFPKVNIWA